MKRDKGWILLWVVAFLVVSAGVAQAQQWANTYGGPGGDWASSIQQTSDGGYIVAGRTESFGAGGGDLWVLKLNPDASVAWQRTYGGAGWDEASSIQQTSDGGYIVAGGTNSFGAGDHDFWVLKLNTDGSIDWERTYGGADRDWASSIQQTSDGGYIVAGVTLSFGAGNGDVWVLKLDPDGTVAWQKTYGGVWKDWASSIQQTSDGGYIVAGVTQSFGEGNGDVWVLKLSPDGTVVWQETYGGAMADEANSIQQTSDGGYIVAGQTYSVGAGSADVWVLKLNPDGSVAWQKAYGGAGWEMASSIQQTSDGGYIVAGETNSFGAGGSDFWVLKLNADGSVAWQKTYGGASSDGAYSIRRTADGGYVVAGAVGLIGAGDWDVWVLKLDANGEIPGCATMGISSATVTDTDAAGSSSGVAGRDSGVSPWPSTATVGDSTASESQVCFFDIDIQGSVATSEAPLAGVTVKLKSLRPRATTKFTTDRVGGYRFEPVNPGRYKIIIGPFSVRSTTAVSGTLQVKGLPSVGTKLKLKNLDTGVVLNTITDASGAFAFAGAAPGRLKIILPGVTMP
jgi:uncharacterized delta-60 repeat protein